MLLMPSGDADVAVSSIPELHGAPDKGYTTATVSIR